MWFSSLLYLSAVLLHLDKRLAWVCKVWQRHGELKGELLSWAFPCWGCQAQLWLTELLLCNSQAWHCAGALIRPQV